MNNKFDYNEDFNFPLVENPLEAAHEIQRSLYQIKEIVNALRIVGLPVADDLNYAVEEIEHLAKQCANGICQESHDRYKEATDVNNKLFSAILSNTLKGD